MNSLSKDQQMELVDYINTHFSKRKTINPNHTSYWYKHFLESRIGFYISNEDCIKAFIDCGFKGANVRNSPNMKFNISEKGLRSHRPSSWKQ